MEERNEKSKLAICKKCGQLIKYTDEDAIWDYSGYGYSTKLVLCKNCGMPHILKYEEDRWMSNIMR